MKDNFFSELTPKSAYWAGFLAADGFVHENKNTITLGLGAKDLNHLKRYEKDLGLKDKIKRNKINNSYYVDIYGAQKAKEDLEKIYNITYKKTFTLQPPNIENAELIRAYICGYIDGDGCIKYENSGKDKRVLRLTILGTESVLRWIKTYFESVLKEETSEPQSLESYFRYRISGNKALRILKHLKDDELPLLDRKWSFNPDISYYSEAKELEYKYEANKIELRDFQNLIAKFSVKKYINAASFDTYYTKAGAEEKFIRFRESDKTPELTIKRKTTDKDNWERIELDLPLDAEKINKPLVDNFVALEDYKQNFRIFKNCFIYWLDNINLVYYIVYDENMSELDRFIEIEINKDKVELLGSNAFQELKNYEQELSVLGITPQHRLKKSLYERYKN